MKFCTNCGRQMKDEQRFCSKCGTDSFQNKSAKPAMKNSTPASQPVYTQANTNIPNAPHPAYTQPNTDISGASQQIHTQPNTNIPNAVQQPHIPAKENVRYASQPVYAQPNNISNNPQPNPLQQSYFSGVKCPSCGSSKLQAITAANNTTTVRGGGYSATNGCLGYLLLGPFGLLCGSCGSKQTATVSNKSKTFWICSNCGNKFRNTNEWMEEIKEAKEKNMMFGVFSIIFFAIGVLIALCGGVIAEDFIAFGTCGGIISLIALIWIIIFVFKKSLLDKEEAECRELDRITKG